MLSTYQRKRLIEADLRELLVRTGDFWDYQPGHSDGSLAAKHETTKAVVAGVRKEVFGLLREARGAGAPEAPAPAEDHSSQILELHAVIGRLMTLVEGHTARLNALEGAVLAL